MLLAPCGVDCGPCEYAAACGGSCYETKGKPAYLAEVGAEVCPLYDCPVNQKGYKTCAECGELPCALYYEWKDPSSTVEEHQANVAERVRLLKALAQNTETA